MTASSRTASSRTASGQARATGTTQAGTRLGAWVDRLGLSAIVALYLALTVWFSLTIPAFETPDELYHYGFVRHLAQGNPLPVQSAEATGPWQQEGSQAPLYYWLAGRLTAGVDQSDFEAWARTNPRANMGDPLFPGNKNRMLFSAAPQPLTGSILALRMARWLSVGLGLVTLLCVAATARYALPGRRALLPPLILAALPQFVFISASCSNDNAVIAASALGIWWLARLIVTDRRRPIALWEWAVLGVILGLAALSKLQGLGLWLLAASVGGALAARRRDLGVLWRAALPVALPAVAIAGWWYWRNVTLYGDWTGLEHLVSINGQRSAPLTWDGWWLEFRGLRYSFWGLFGWFNILLPEWMYAVMDGVSGAALLGLLVAPWLRRARSADMAPGASQDVRRLLAVWAILSFALVIYWVIRAQGSQGRLFFPAIGATVTLLVLGLENWLGLLPSRLRAWSGGAVWAAWWGLLLAATIYAGMTLFPAAYGPLPPVDALPPQAAPLALTFRGQDGDQIDLRGVAVGTGRYSAGDWAPVTLYLMTPAPLRHDYEVFVQLLDEQGAVLGNVTTHPGWGRHPTRLWQAGALYADAYQVQVRQRIDPDSPLLARVYTGFVASSDPTLTPLPTVDAAGQAVSVGGSIVGEVTLLPWSGPEVAALGLTPVAAAFGARIGLEQAAYPATVAAGETLTVTLLWQGLAAPEVDYTAFVHLLDADETLLVGYDQGPGGLRFPTRAWQAGDQVLSRFPLAVPAHTPPGEYTLWVGLYDATSAGAARLPVNDGSGRSVAHEMVALGAVTVR